MAKFEKGSRQQDGSNAQKLQNFGANLVSFSPSARFIAGGRVIIKINHKPAPRLSAISWRIITEQRQNREIDNASAFELMPTVIDVTGSYSEYREPFRSANSMFYQGTPMSFMFHPYMVIEVRDSLTDALLFYSGKCAITERSESVDVNGLMMTNVQWKSLSWKDEREPTIPTQNSDAVQQQSQTPLASVIDSFGLDSSQATGFLKKIF
jgi:hypothetical protein